MNELKNREFREIQVSSSLLVVIFLAVLALGIFIFLLGVSVGKKQVRISGQSQVVTQTVKEAPSETGGGDIKAAPAEEAPPQENRASRTAKTEPKAKSPSVSKPAPPPGSGLYYVQVGAFLEKNQALALAETYRKQGYTVLVTDPRPDDTQTWHRVRLGGFATRERAEDLLKGLNAAAGRKTDYRVVRD